MRRCFVCDRPALYTDKATGEPLCTAHYHPLAKRPTKPAGTLGNEWRMLADIRAWHAGSAYAKDRAMAKRLEKVVR